MLELVNIPSHILNALSLININLNFTQRVLSDISNFVARKMSSIEQFT